MSGGEKIGAKTVPSAGPVCMSSVGIHENPMISWDKGRLCAESLAQGSSSFLPALFPYPLPPPLPTPRLKLEPDRLTFHLGEQCVIIEVGFAPISQKRN